MEYKEMQGEDKVRYINSMLSTANLTDICTDLKVSKKTIRDEFKEMNFIYNKHERLYLKEKMQSQEPGFIQLSELDYINKRIDALEIDIQNIKVQAKGVNTSCNDMNIFDDELTGELKVKSFKVYTTVLNDFIDFSKAFKSIKKQDLVSQALLEFIKNHE